jgi:hypothetical protein
MNRFDFASLGGQPECPRTDPEDTSRFAEIHPSFRLASAGVVTGNVVGTAEGDHSFASPTISPPSQQSISIQDVGQQIIRTDPRQHSHRLNNVL